MTSILSAVSLVSKLPKGVNQSHSLIFELKGALEDLEKALEQKEHPATQNQVEETIPILESVLTSPRQKIFTNNVTTKDRFDYFKSFIYSTDHAKNWNTYLLPLTNLLTQLKQYQNPSFYNPRPSLADLKQALKPAIELIEKESNDQQGLVAKAVTTATDQLKREAKKTVQNVQKSIFGPPSKTKPLSFPLVKIKQLIGTYQGNRNAYLQSSQEHQLSKALRDLDQQSLWLSGIEEFVYQKLEKGNLHTDLKRLNELILEFIQLQGDRLLKQTRKDEALWAAAIEYNETRAFEHLSNQMKGKVASPTELDQILNRAIHFFKMERSSELHPNRLKTVKDAISSYLDLLDIWMKEHIKPSERHALEHQLNCLKQKLNSGSYLEVLVEMKNILQTSPLAKKMYREEHFASPIETIRQVKTTLKDSLTPKSPVKSEDWNRQIEREKARLIDHLSYISTFQTIDTLFPFQGESNDAYARIMKEVLKAPKANRQETFLRILKSEIDQCQDLGALKKFASKVLSSIFIVIIQFIAKHFVPSFIDYLITTLSLPSDKPLSTIHLNPIERINDFLITQKKALNRWNDDRDGKNFGVKGFSKSMEVILKDPSLNNGYRHQELLDQTIKLAIDQFLHIESSPIISKMLRFFVKKGLIYFNIGNITLNAMKKTFYQDSQYLYAIDQWLLENLKEIETLIDLEEGNASQNFESRKAKKLFQESVKNLIEVIDQSSNDKGIVNISSKVKELGDEQLRNAIVELLINNYQLLLTKEKMSRLFLAAFKSTNDSLIPQTTIHSFYSKEEKDALAKALKREPTDDDLKAQFARDYRKEVESLTNADIESKLKEKYAKIENDLHEVTCRVIQKSVDQAIQHESDHTLISPNQALIDYLDFIDPHLLQSGTSNLPNFFEKAKQALENLNSSDPKKIEPLYQDLMVFLKNYEKQQELIDRKQSGVDQTMEHRSCINQISNEIILPKLIEFQEILKQFIQTQNFEHVENALSSLKAFKKSVYQQQAKLEEIRRDVLEIDSQSLHWKNQIAQKISPLFTDQVKNYANSRLNQIAQETILLIKDENVCESFFRHVIMLNFVESHGHQKGIKA